MSGSVYRRKALGYEQIDFYGMVHRLFVLRQAIAGDGLDPGLRARTQSQFHKSSLEIDRITDIPQIQ